MKFTNSKIRALKARAERYEVWETGRRGFGLRVSPQGRKSWVFLYRVNGRPRRMTLGTFEGATGATPKMSLADAHAAHGQAEKKLAGGIDPGARLVDQRHRDRTAPTVKELADEYLERHARPNKRSAGEDERILKADVLPQWGSRRADSITRRDAIKLLDAITDRGAPIQANRVLALIKKMWNFGMEREIVPATPFPGLKPPAKETPRDRVLDDAEIRRFWSGLDAPGLGMSRPVALALKLLLVTIQRRSEVACARKSEFTFGDDPTWAIPAERSKNATAHSVPLSPLAVSLLQEAYDLAGDSEWLFPSPNGANSISPGSISHALRNNLEFLGLENARPHDLRRTGASGLAGLGISRVVVEKVLHHVEGGIIGVYDRFSYDTPKREALTAWGARLTEITSGQTADTGKVVKLRDG